MMQGVIAWSRESACYTKSKVDLSKEAGWTPQLGWLLCSSLLLRGTGLLLNKHFCSGGVRAPTCSAQEGEQQNTSEGRPGKMHSSFVGCRAQLLAQLLGFLSQEERQKAAFPTQPRSKR